MGRFWSIVFLLVPILGCAVFALAAADLPPFRGIWLPKDISAKGYLIDNLFYFIMYLTGVIFLGTGVVLAWFLWKYDADHNSQPIRFVHGSHTLELVWSVLPAATLLFIAIYQMDTWAAEKVDRPPMLAGPDGIVGTADDTAMIEVTGRQFEWRVQYPGPDGILYTQDDLHTVNDLHIPLGETMVIAIKSDDVLHDFFLPNLRVKQDVVPGMKQFVWFTAMERGTYDIACAELCGWGHYKMKGQLTVENREDYQSWLDQVWQQQNVAEYTPPEVD